jgi:hypothetical protein
MSSFSFRDLWFKVLSLGNGSFLYAQTIMKRRGVDAVQKAVINIYSEREL